MQNRLPLIVAIVLGIIAILAVRSYVKRIEKEAQDRFKGRPVVAAKQDLAAGDEISVNNISAKEVPADFIPPQAIEGSEEVKLIVGRKMRVPVRAGQIILWSDLAGESRGGFSSLIPEGERAFTVEISRGVRGGLLQPNDHVDIICSFAAPQVLAPATGTTATWRDQSDMVNIVLLQNVAVLALGESYGAGPQQNQQSRGNITVSVTLQEAQLLMFAAEHGELGAVLRREGEIATLERHALPRVTFKELEGLIGNLDNERKKRIIQIQKGRSVESVVVEEPVK